MEFMSIASKIDITIQNYDSFVPNSSPIFTITTILSVISIVQWVPTYFNSNY